MQQVTVGDIAKDHPPLQPGEQVDYPEVSHEASIQDIYKYLSEHEGILINENGERKVLKHTDVFKYLDTSQRGDA
jgi:osmoprotectant transport system ATP-binding protein